MSKFRDHTLYVLCYFYNVLCTLSQFRFIRVSLCNSARLTCSVETLLDLTWSCNKTYLYRRFAVFIRSFISSLIFPILPFPPATFYRQLLYWVCIVGLWRAEVLPTAKRRCKQRTRCIRETWGRGPDCRSRTSKPSIWRTARTRAHERGWRVRVSMADIRTRTTAAAVTVRTALLANTAMHSLNQLTVSSVCDITIVRALVIS